MKNLILLLTLCGAAAPLRAQQLTIQDCGSPRQKCIFDERGSLRYWVTEYHHWDNSTRTMKNFYVTAYADIKFKQEQYHDWLDPQFKSNPRFDIVPSGRLNIRTMRIPAWKARWRSMQIYSRFQLDCHHGVAERLATGDPQVESMRKICSLDVLEFSKAPNPAGSAADTLYPTEELRNRAAIIRDGYLAAQEYDAVVRQLQPLTEVWNQLNDPDWQRLGETDHFEITQVPAGFMEKLGDAEFLMESRVSFAEGNEKSYRQAAQPEP